MTNEVAVDASLAAMWAIPERYSARALTLADQWAKSDVRLIAPCLMLTELTNALYKRILRGELVLKTAIEALQVVMEFGIQLQEEPGLHWKAMELSYDLKRSSTYDCHYLALSEIHDCDLWTGDERFYNSVRKSFRRVHWIENYR